MIAVSIVSHNHGVMVSELLSKMAKINQITEIVLTKNIPENIFIPNSDKIKVIENEFPLGFGRNHNNAFKHINSDYFCVINPDISFQTCPFEHLLQTLINNNLDLVAPLVLNKFGKKEDSARYFPTLLSLLKKFVFKDQGTYINNTKEETFHPDWIAGMFMLFKGTSFKYLNGFDEDFYLYYEDVDLCMRIWKSKMKLAVCSKISVTHDARRSSHKSIKFGIIHLTSMIRFFNKHGGYLKKIQSYS